MTTIVSIALCLAALVYVVYKANHKIVDHIELKTSKVDESNNAPVLENVVVIEVEQAPMPNYEPIIEAEKPTIKIKKTRAPRGSKKPKKKQS